MAMGENESRLNHGINTIEQAERRFKNLRRQVRAMQRIGQPISGDILAELCALDSSLAKRAEWVSNFIPSKNIPPRRLK